MTYLPKKFEKKPEPRIVEAFEKWAPAVGPWARAAGVERDDVRGTIVMVVLAGGDPGRDVPRALRIRKIGGEWRPLDSCVFAEGDDALAELAAPEVEQELQPDPSGLAAALVGGTAAVAAAGGVGRRAAQLRVRAQAERFAACGDLFAAPEGGA